MYDKVGHTKPGHWVSPRYPSERPSRRETVTKGRLNIPRILPVLKRGIDIV